ncbi:phosphoadenylyl-sulfate reductase [Sphingomonas sp. AOB5]|uniref:phosphoadenylyl-sulfate reductase n=1 Tax=Sphingomonas sp. AOB5 TaxID=3034017 RepID=UPI0023F9E0B9|nr:phosphoadenylyl-sulfate reductase [Sphingomonas sp. AOB5]MDF7776007.1 phosphoadenylyl-sulfate reductase [Sphingomonas sp. AOB5]
MADADIRKVDRIDLTPRFTEADAVRLNNMFRGADTLEMLRAVLGNHMLGDVGIVSSFGAESAALLHLIASVDRSIPVMFIDTGKHFPETLAYRDQLAELLGLNLRILSPDPETITKRDETGLRWSYDPDGCCEIRKVAPLEKALVDFDATITGRKAFQASTRGNLPRFEIDGDRLKVNPFASWTKADLEAYFEAHDLPRHPLEAQGYLSIGCAPCTSVVKPGEDPRAGRWRGWEKTECGIHTPTDDNDPNLPVF